ncbi:hypothetical protein YSY43_20810 [Paenibacillus sp. YSY-4.3]
MKAKIRIYVTSDCPSCKEAISYLKRKNTPYELVDVTYSKQHFKEMMGLGGFATPFIVLDERKLYYFNPKILDWLLEDQHG